VTRIPSHTIQDAPEASRPLLDGLVQVSPTGRLFTAYFLNYAQTPMDLPGEAA
jgi:hypothetical protein